MGDVRLMPGTIFITTTRADFGILNHLISIYHYHNKDYGIIASGIHLNKEYGYSYNEIIRHNYRNVRAINVNSGSIDIFSEIENVYHKFPKVLRELKPEKVVVLGDRYEIFSIVNICLLLNIPVVHFHGGELTEGAFDDNLRHCITKMSRLHFTISLEYMNRIIQMGENPDTVYCFGSLSVNYLYEKYGNSSLSKKEYLERKNIIVILHPETKTKRNFNIVEIIERIIKSVNKKIFVFLPNNDPGREIIYNQIKSLKNVNIVENMPYEDYIDLLSKSYFIIGNSSSGLIEAPVLKVPTINIGKRQKGRIETKSIINVANENIESAIMKINNESFINSILTMKVPFYFPNGNELIFNTIESFNFKKNYSFYDVSKKNISNDM